jgi:NTE family protein
MPTRALVLGGGNALGCYLAGAYEALHDAGEQPDWVAGTSIGAMMAAIIAGNAPERRMERLQAFWRRAASPDWLPWPRGAQWLAALQTRVLGRPGLFYPRLMQLSGEPDRTGVYDTAPMRRALAELVDFGRLNGGETRLSICTTDLESGEQVVFDSGRDRLTPDHLLASAALIPDFAPVRIGDRWLVDGGFASNVPIDLVLDPPPTAEMVCYFVDLVPLRAPLPASLAGMSMRQTDLTFACQTQRTLEALLALDRTRGPQRPRVDVVPVCYADEAGETAMKSWDFSQTAVTRRWKAGHGDMRAALARFREAAASGPGLTVHSGSRPGAHQVG